MEGKAGREWLPRNVTFSLPAACGVMGPADCSTFEDARSLFPLHPGPRASSPSSPDSSPKPGRFCCNHTQCWADSSWGLITSLLCTRERPESMGIKEGSVLTCSVLMIEIKAFKVGSYALG
jgi:hypothetical protein